MWTRQRESRLQEGTPVRAAGLLPRRQGWLQGMMSKEGTRAERGPWAIIKVGALVG